MPIPEISTVRVMLNYLLQASSKPLAFSYRAAAIRSAGAVRAVTLCNSKLVSTRTAVGTVQYQQSPLRPKTVARDSGDAVVIGLIQRKNAFGSSDSAR